MSLLVETWTYVYFDSIESERDFEPGNNNSGKNTYNCKLCGSVFIPKDIKSPSLSVIKNQN